MTGAENSQVLLELTDYAIVMMSLTVIATVLLPIFKPVVIANSAIGRTPLSGAVDSILLPQQFQVGAATMLLKTTANALKGSLQITFLACWIVMMMIQTNFVANKVASEHLPLVLEYFPLKPSTAGRTFSNTRCQGDCDADDDCADGLGCYMRDGFEPVPGCEGGEEEPLAYDYCVVPPV
ncbi:expressed unknown protein [Seminavis robusta]|uniref:Uncharacterized protein n=1 Tax=Seminavis robusta TaxID=568900 RepID=A0A9N8HL75_9STRA|nr:expressed unknown protein [Seminavis robusta]|eukprot:Sro802_g204600.1 n/a (180) ;mRNA; r:13101-13982